jgi:uncharacterized membrane protein
MATAKKAQPKAPAKAAAVSAPAATSSSNTDFWKWLYVAGILVASVAGAFGFHNDILSIVLALVGILSGLFYFNPDDLMNFGLRYLIVAAAAGSLSAFPAVGGYITGFFTAFAAFLGPVILALVVRFFWKKYFGSM